MRGWFRKIRGLLGVGLTWGALWAGVGAVIGFVISVVAPSSWTIGDPVADWAIGIGVYGLVSGIGFGGLLSLTEARKRIRDLSLKRVGFWGVLGAAFVPSLFGLLGTFPAGTTPADVLQAMAVTAFLGGTFASSSVAVARRAELEAEDAPERLDRGDRARPGPDLARHLSSRASAELR